MNEENEKLCEEMKSRGMYKIEGLWYGAPYTPVERLNQPITPRENLLRYYRGKKYAWIPDIVSDQIDITPECNPDIKACGYEGGLDAFEVKWIPVEGGMLPAFVEPGFILLEDIADWRNLKWPNPDAWDWEGDAKKYQETYKDDDRLRRGVILTGYFERLISIMGFENAAVSLLTDPEEVAAFFEHLTELNIRIMDHYIDDLGCESIMLHDDWSAQRSPFFSLETARKLLVPPLKKLTDYAHARGILFTLHSCGNGLDLVPAIKETGADAWQVQIDAVDEMAAYEACGDELMMECYPVLPEGIHGEELEACIRTTLEKFCIRHRALVDFYDMEEGRWQETRRLIYKVGRAMVLKNE